MKTYTICGLTLLLLSACSQQQVDEANTALVAVKAACELNGTVQVVQGKPGQTVGEICLVAQGVPAIVLVTPETPASK